MRIIVVYRVKGARIELLRLLHGPQQWPKCRAVEERLNKLTKTRTSPAPGAGGRKTRVGHLQERGCCQHGDEKGCQGLRHIAQVNSAVPASGSDMHVHAIGGEPFGQKAQALG